MFRYAEELRGRKYILMSACVPPRSLDPAWSTATTREFMKIKAKSAWLLNSHELSSNQKTVTTPSSLTQVTLRESAMVSFLNSAGRCLDHSLFSHTRVVQKIYDGSVPQLCLPCIHRCLFLSRRCRPENLRCCRFSTVSVCALNKSSAVTHVSLRAFALVPFLSNV